MEIQHAPFIIKEIKRFLSVNLYDSADQLANLFLSSIHHRSTENEASASSNSNNQKAAGKDSQHVVVVAELYELIADIAYQRKEIRRALNYYRLAIQQKKLSSNQSNNNSSSSPFPANNNFRNQVSIVMNEQDAKLRFKECKCQAELRETASALRDLESIPAKYRDLPILLLMAQLYNDSNLRRHAVSAYKEALLQAPLSMEIIQQLINYNCDYQEIMEVIQESIKQSSSSSSENHTASTLLTNEKWLQSLILSLIQKKNYDTEKSYTNLLSLNVLFPKNPFVMSLIALNAMDAEQIENSIASFKRIRQMDATIVDCMDIYAKQLFLKRDELELNRLANEVIENHPIKPQGYLIASWYCLLKGDTEHAASFVEKALMLNPKYPETYKVKGRQLYYQKNFESALIAFSQANTMQKDLHSFIGIIESNIALGKYKDAANSAREMVLLYQKSAEVYYVMGTVLAKSPQGASESIRAYNKALRIQPRLKKAAIALSTTLLELNRPEESLECLKTILAKVSDAKLRLLLAKTYSALGKYHEALEQLQICISLQPTKTDPEATKEIERIENILKGENSTTNFQEEEEEVEEEEQEEEEDDDRMQSAVRRHDQSFTSSVISGVAMSGGVVGTGMNTTRTVVRRRREEYEVDVGGMGEIDDDDDDFISPDRASSLMNEHIAHGNNLFSRQMMSEFSSSAMFLDDDDEGEEDS